MSSNANDNMTHDWPEPKRFRKSIRLEFSLYISAVIIILMVITGYVVTKQFTKTVTENVVNILLTQARSYSSLAGKHIISSDNPDVLMLTNICQRLSMENGDVYWVGITATDSVFLAHTDMKKVVSKASMTFPVGERASEIIDLPEQIAIHNDTINLIIPIEENGTTLGYLGIAASTRQITEAKHRSILTVSAITFLMIMIGLPFIMLVLNRRLKPISIITKHLKEADLENISLDIPVNSNNEFGYLAETLRVMGNRLQAAQDDMLEQERINRELEIAREIQSKILPREYPQSPLYEFYGTYKSARLVGGDYYDFIDFGDGELAFLVADVSGKSLPGMLVMLITRDIVQDVTRTLRQPEAVLSAINSQLLKNIRKGMFVTMFYGLLNTHKGLFTFGSAGHNPLIKVNSNLTKPELYNPKGYPLGMMSEKMFDERIESGKILLSEQDWLIQYTDGINEAHNIYQEEFGMERFLNAVTAHLTAHPNQMIEQVLAEHSAFVGEASQYDDITLVAMKWLGVAVDKENADKMETTGAY